MDKACRSHRRSWEDGLAKVSSMSCRESAFGYDGEVTEGGVVYHKDQCQPNAGRIPSSVREWREANGGTYAVMASILIKKDGTKEDVQSAVDDVVKKF